MTKERKLLFGCVVAAFAVALGFVLVRHISEANGRKTAPTPRELFSAVPSDAAYAACFEHAADGLRQLLDSESVFRRFDLGAFSSAQMVLAYNYAAQLVPLMGIDVSDGNFATVRHSAEASGLKTRVVAVASRTVLLMSPSMSMLDQAQSHIDSGTSILDAPLFKDALSLSAANSIIIRNSSIHRLLPGKSVIYKYLQRKDIAGFLKRFSEWMVFNMNDDGSFASCPVSSISPLFYHETLSNGGVSKLSEMLPPGLEFAVGLCFDDWKTRQMLLDGYYDAYNRISEHKTEEKVANSLNVKEIAKIIYGGVELLLVRPGSVPSKIPSWNPDLLFGSVFAIPDSGCGVVFNNWIVYGRQETVDEYILNLKSVLPSWPEGEISAVLYCKDIGLLSVRSDNIKCVWNLNR